MELNHYQTQAMTTCLPSSDNLPYMITGLCSEAGEVAGAYKKYIRGDYPKEQAVDLLKKEIGDVLWYCAGLAQQLNCTLDEIAQQNLDKLQQRKQHNSIQGNGDFR